jgi:hypothetical protein
MDELLSALKPVCMGAVRCITHSTSNWRSPCSHTYRPVSYHYWIWSDQSQVILIQDRSDLLWIDSPTCWNTSVSSWQQAWYCALPKSQRLSQFEGTGFSLLAIAHNWTVTDQVSSNYMYSRSLQVEGGTSWQFGWLSELWYCQNCLSLHL